MQSLKRVLRNPIKPRDVAAGAGKGTPLLKRVPRWWPVVAIVVVAAVVAGVLRIRQGTSQAASSRQLYTVQRGNLVATVSATGEVYAPRQAELCFDVNRIPLIELHVAPGQQVEAGDVLARIDPTGLERAVTQAEADLTVAQDNLEKARNPYTGLDLARARLAVDQAQVALAEAQESLQAVLKPDIVAAESAVRDAEVALKSAESQLVAAQNSPDSAARLRTLEYEAIWYRNNYWEAQARFDRGEIDQQKLNWEYSNMLAAEERLRSAQAQAESSLASAENQVAKAQRNYQDALDNLARLQAGPDATELAKARNQVAQAEYNLEKARADLAAIEAGPDPKDVEVAQARVLSAQATLEAARAALEAATMVAPFDGTVVSVGATEGDLVSSSTVVVTLADLSLLRIRATVDETDISNVEIGQEVTITFDALPGERFRGQVLEVPLQGRLTQNVVTYEVPVSLEGAEGAPLRSGMTANLSIVAGRRENVLLVPAVAVLQGEEGNVVRVQDTPQGPVQEARVVLGLRDGVYVEVRQGLNEGDRVVIEYQAVQTSPADAFRSMMPGMPGGGQVIERRIGP
jgi:HlyD family secretion protein